jgi:putative ABC transport system permease protein
VGIRTWAQEKSSNLKSVNFMLRAQGDPPALTSSVIAALREIDARLIATDMRTQSGQIDDSLRFEGIFAQTSTFFGLLALLLAAVGLYGTPTYSVVRRQREMGIRLALGAQPGRLLRLVRMQGLRLVLLGIAAGWIASALAGCLLTGMIANVLFHVHALDDFSFIGAAIILTILGSAAALLPARRAASTDPMQALRTE